MQFCYCIGARDCKVSNWAGWSECSTSCGFGTMERTRTVIQTAKNGGKQCLPLKQTRGCYLNSICEESKCKYDRFNILALFPLVTLSAQNNFVSSQNYNKTLNK